MMQFLQHAKTIAESIMHSAIKLADEAFTSPGWIDYKSDHDLVTRVDIDLQNLIVQQLLHYFPDHRIISEESLARGESEWTWVLDPLDGTNNFAIGLPIFGTALTLIHQGTSQLALVFQGLSGASLIAQRGVGVSSQPALYVQPPRVSKAVCTSLWLGYETSRNSPLVASIEAEMRQQAPRLLETWCPVADVFAYATGAVDVIASIDVDGFEMPAVCLVLSELGATIQSFGPETMDSTGFPRKLLISRPGTDVSRLERILSST